MSILYTRVKLYLEANSKTWDNTKVSLQDDGDGDYIKSWSYDIAEPTSTQLASYETAGNAAEANAGIDATRRTEYLSWDKQMEMIYKDQKNGTTTFKDHCDKVRSDNPKG
jgi:hypothetical protein